MGYIVCAQKFRRLQEETIALEASSLGTQGGNMEKLFTVVATYDKQVKPCRKYYCSLLAPRGHHDKILPRVPFTCRMDTAALLGRHE